MDRTCTAEGCIKPARATGLCSAHYESKRKAERRAGIAGNERPCEGCGALIRRSKPRGPISPYCSDDCKPRCEIPECRSPAAGRGWCIFHYSRWREAGDPNAPITVERHKGRTCAVEGCSKKQRKREWCSSHYGQYMRIGEVGPLAYSWAAGDKCVVCGEQTRREAGRRKYCSAACQRLYHKHGGDVPSVRLCAVCGGAIDLLERGKTGARKRSDVRVCRRCRQDTRKHGMSVLQLAQRDGTVCRLCGGEVDMTMRSPDLMRPSVDHIMPRALGGSNDPTNLQLAHAWCNSRKQHRVAPG